MLASIDITSIEVRTEIELKQCDGLIIPGGESTTMMRQIDMAGLRHALERFAKNQPVFGTCAGLIMMSQSVKDFNFKPFGWLNVSIERNAYGRQIDSFCAPIPILNDTLKKYASSKGKLDAFFIRAPKITSCDESVNVLAAYQDEPVLVQQGHFLGASFHPELTSESAIHRFFCSPHFFK